MNAPTDESDFVELSSELEDGVWTVTASLNDTTIKVQTNTEDADSLPLLVNSFNQILETAWEAIEDQIAQEAP